MRSDSLYESEPKRRDLQRDPSGYSNSMPTQRLDSGVELRHGDIMTLSRHDWIHAVGSDFASETDAELNFDPSTHPRVVRRWRVDRKGF